MAADQRPIFITARFRSGSTLLWNLFRSVPGYRAFYEPCHDGLPQNIHNRWTDETHQGVTSYWSEYRPIVETVRRLHRNEFGVARLYLEADDDYPEFEFYLRGLMDECGDSTPVLQFNRVDFRLPWLRRRFSQARIVHLERNPRDSWLSMVRTLPISEWDHPLSEDPYDLLLWSVSLSPQFPFLTADRIANSYERHYYLWRLSSLAGRRGADCTVDYDLDLQQEPSRGLAKLAELAPALTPHLEQALGLIHQHEPARWKRFRDAKWFEEIETRCETELEDLGLVEAFGVRPLAEIVATHGERWAPLYREPHTQAHAQLLSIYSRCRSRRIESFAANFDLLQQVAQLQRETAVCRRLEEQWRADSAALTEARAQWQLEHAGWTAAKIAWDQQRTAWSARLTTLEAEHADWLNKQSQWDEQRAAWERERDAQTRRLEQIQKQFSEQHSQAQYWMQEAARCQSELAAVIRERDACLHERNALEARLAPVVGLGSMSLGVARLAHRLSLRMPRLAAGAKFVVRRLRRLLHRHPSRSVPSEPASLVIHQQTDSRARDAA